MRRRRKEPDLTASMIVGRAVTALPASGRKIARLLMSDAGQLPEMEQGFIAHLLQRAPGLADAITVAKRLNKLLRRDSQESLAQVLDAAAKTPLAEFAAGLRRDFAAVQAALDLPWTTSPAEGQINRLKMVKRTMYGRAGFNKIEHRLLSFITMNWKAEPLVSYRVIVDLIAATTTKTGLTVRCELDSTHYPKGIVMSDREMDRLHITRDAFHGEWNYTIHPAETNASPVKAIIFG